MCLYLCYRFLNDKINGLPKKKITTELGAKLDLFSVTISPMNILQPETGTYFEMIDFGSGKEPYKIKLMFRWFVFNCLLKKKKIEISVPD